MINNIEGDYKEILEWIDTFHPFKEVGWTSSGGNNAKGLFNERDDNWWQKPKLKHVPIWKHLQEDIKHLVGWNQPKVSQYHSPDNYCFYHNPVVPPQVYRGM